MEKQENLIEEEKNIKKKNNLSCGNRNDYQAYIGPAYEYDIMCGRQFTLLFNLGLRETDNVLDFGCGSLRLGRVLLNYLNKGKYYGIEPNKWLIKSAIKNELGQDLVDIKNPNFSHNSDFNSKVFGEKFNFIVAQSIFSHCTMALFKRTLSNFVESINDNGLICFTLLIDKMHHGKSKHICQPDDFRWLYPKCSIFRFKQVLEFTNTLGFCTDIDGYHRSQKWFVFSKNKEIIDVISKNKKNLTDLPYKFPILWKHSNLEFRKKI